MTNYWKSQEGLKEYEKIEYPYPTSEWDKDYDLFVEKTKNSVDKQKIKVGRITRIQGADNKEYLTYDETVTRFDGLGNSFKRFRENLGTYPIPQARREVTYDSNNNQQVKTVGINNIETGYSIPFSKAKLDEIHKNAIDNVAQRAGKTQYFVQKVNAPPVTVQSFEDLKEADFEELYKYGKKSFGWKEEKEHLKQEHEQLMTAQEISDNKQIDEETRLRARVLEEQIQSGALERDTASPLRETDASDSVEILEDESQEDKELAEEAREKEKDTTTTSNNNKSNIKRRSK